MSERGHSEIERSEEQVSLPLGIVVNPLSGRDARRLFARAMTSSHESKRNQIERLIVGAVAAGVEHVMLARDPFRIAESALEALGVPVESTLLDVGACARPADTPAAVARMRELGCGALAVLGGDGTCRLVARSHGDVPLLALSTGTNNVFPAMLEATVAGAAAGAVAAGGVEARRVASRCKQVHIEIDGEAPDLALIDAVHLRDDSLGSLLPFDPQCMRTIVLARALPYAVGCSPIGGLLHPCLAEDDFAVRVECSGDVGNARTLLAPISPGLYRRVHVRNAGRLALGERVVVEGPGLLAFDGDRARVLASGQRASLWVERDGPRVIDAALALREAAANGLYLDREYWRDARDAGGLGGCC